MQKIYHYDQNTFEFILFSYADISPLEPGVFLVPAFATTIEPPACTNFEKQIFAESTQEWHIVADYRSIKLYSTFDGADISAQLGQTLAYLNATTQPQPTVSHEFINDTWVLNKSKQATLSAKQIADTKSMVWQQIQEKRDAVSAGGFKVGDKWFHSDEASRTKYLSLQLLGANMPNNIQWKTMDGTFVTMTPTLASQIFQAALIADTQTYAVAEAHHVALRASKDPANYDFGANWTPIFSELGG